MFRRLRRLTRLIFAALGLLIGGGGPQLAMAGGGGLQGTVKDPEGLPLEGVTISLECSCLDAPLFVDTNERGIYVVDGLPRGDYTVTASRGQGGQVKGTVVSGSARTRLDFSFAPNDKIIRYIDLGDGPVSSKGTDGGRKIDGETVQKLPLGDPGDGVGSAIEGGVDTKKGPGGHQIAGSDSSSHNLTLDGNSGNNPITGQPTSSVIAEALESVEIKEAGYEAEFGAASGAQIRARRLSGSNVWRGQAGFRFSPRLADPRFITGTDEALRVVQTPDFGGQAFVVASGPIVKDRLFVTVALAPKGARQTLTQSFHHRVDLDGSGGFEACPYENGNNDCAPGTNYIATRKFAEQSYKTGNVGVDYLLGLDFAINRRHTLRLTANGGPSFGRTSYRLPFASDPNAFGTNPAEDPLGGAANIATGIIDDHFGWDFDNQVLVGLGYEGRALQDKLEIDAGVSWLHATSRDAWRLDNPELRNLPVTQEQDAQGKNLFEFLDGDGRLASVPGVDEACNDPDLPGLACPTRVWLSGGIGEYGRDRGQRVEGRFALTHYFDAAGFHKLKYGGTAAWLQRDLVSQYSGSNEPDFADNCEPGESGGGEWCWSPTGSYRNAGGGRVDNHRFIVVDSDNPEQRFTRGYGRVRYEENELRAIADPLGRGVRVDAYRSKLSTFNYAIFLQDQWSILSNLSVSAGVRWEMQDMRDVLGRRAIFIKDNVAPRVGIVYDWTDEGRSRLYASYGWFFQPLPLQLNSRVFGGLVQVNRQFRLSDCEDRQTQTLEGGKDRWRDGQPTQWCVDSHQSTTGLTPGLKVPKLKGQYNRQFQIGYEHEVIEDLIIGARWLHTDLGRAVEDISTNGGLDFIIANPGTGVAASEIRAQQATCDSLAAELEELGDDPAANAVARDLGRCRFAIDAYERVGTDFPKPQRNYDAVSVELRRRFAKNWMMLASYTYSRLFGNYDGFVDPISGSINLGSSLQYDTPELVRNARGPLSSDQTHRAKLDGYYTFALDRGRGGWLTVGASFRLSSGFPVGVMGGYARLPGSNVIHVLPRGSGGRLPVNYRVNTSLGWAYELPRDLVLELGARFFNVTNAKATLRVDEVYTYAASRPIVGGEHADLKHAKVQPNGGSNNFFNRTIATPQGNYGVATQFQRPLSAQFEVKLRF